MNFLRSLKRNLLLEIVITLVATWIFFFIFAFIVNNNVTKFEADLETKVNVSDINKDFFVNKLIKYKKDSEGNYILENGEKVFDGYSYNADFNKIYDNNDIEVKEEDGKIKVIIKAKYFISTQSQTVSNESFTRYQNVINKVFKAYDKEYKVEYHMNNYYNAYLYSLIGLGLGLIASLVVAYLLRNKYQEVELAEGEFKYPFSLNYWKSAGRRFSKIRIVDIALISIMFALQLAAKMLPIPSGFGNLGIGITYLIFAIICMAYGPLWGLVIGMFSDILGELLFPSGFAFNFGYTIQAMLSGFVYGLCFYRTKLTFSKALFARLIINIILNAFYGSILWGFVSHLTYEATLDYMFYLSLPKNIIYLIPQSILLYYILKLVKPLFLRNNLFVE